MEAYANAKMELFKNIKSDGLAVVCGEDAVSENILAQISCKKLVYGFNSKSDIRAVELYPEQDGIAFLLKWSGKEQRIFIHMTGAHNVLNALAAFSVCWGLGMPADKVIEGLEKPVNIPGRLEKVYSEMPFRVWIDYAHTPDALSVVLQSIRSIARGRIILVFGCGGDRDRGKRLLMGKVATLFADKVILTSDNPRSENPERIVEDILSGIDMNNNVVVEINRRRAIIKAIDYARAGDEVIIAGKGHETVQILSDRSIPFSDRDIAAQHLSEREKHLLDYKWQSY
jgi:UDP-N-acetylmuramoyl-L-alanyl-D-glutamate--2,6-diaminopimelate ligase